MTQLNVNWFGNVTEILELQGGNQMREEYFSMHFYDWIMDEFCDFILVKVVRNKWIEVVLRYILESEIEWDWFEVIFVQLGTILIFSWVEDCGVKLLYWFNDNRGRVLFIECVFLMDLKLRMSMLLIHEIEMRIYIKWTMIYCSCYNYKGLNLSIKIKIKSPEQKLK